MSAVTAPTPEQLQDHAFAACQAHTWAARLFRTWHAEEMRPRYPAQAAALALEINRGEAEITARINLSSGGVAFFVHYPTGETRHLVDLVLGPPRDVGP